MKKINIFIGVAWPYVNGDLHLGHLSGCLLPADIFARFHRLVGNNVLMISGSDCHGTPITLEAEKKKVSPQEIVKIYHPKHKEVFKIFDISFDLYTKTTTKNHKKVVQDFFLQMVKNGYIFKKSSFQYFSPKEKKFLPDRYVEGTCSYCGFSSARGDQCDKCGRVLEVGELIKPKSKLNGEEVCLKESEHYYFDIPRLMPFLNNYVNKRGPSWREWIYKETTEWLKKGLQPRCVTRDINWGVRIPNRGLPKDFKIHEIKNKRFYVWFEAVIGYLSGSMEWSKNTKKWQKFWYSNQKSLRHYYFIGKDNLVFHTLFWPAQLMAADKNFHLPDYVIANQFLLLEGQAFSKSRGVFIKAEEFGKKYNPDALRFYLALIMPENSDSNFSFNEFLEINNNVLVGNLGNFINRVWNLAKFLKRFSTRNLEEKVVKEIDKFLKEAKNNITKCQFKNYVKSIIKLADFGNKYLSEKTPWNLEKNSLEYKKIINTAILIILALNMLFIPLIPRTSRKLSKILNVKIERWPDKEISYLKSLLNKIKIKKPEPLFNKISSAEIN